MCDISRRVGKACDREAGERVPTMPMTIVARPWWARRFTVRMVTPTFWPRLCPPYSLSME
jgi:hypothetical protein